MKKILYVVESFAAGVYTFLNELCNSIAEGYEVVIIYSLRKETPDNFKNDFNPKIKFIQIDMCRGFSFHKNIRSLVELKRILKEEKPDIVHLHSSKAGFLGRMACYANKFNMNNVFYNPHGFSFLQQNEAVFKRKLFYFLECFAGRLGGYIIGCSKGEFEEALKISKKCININNGVDTDKIDEFIKENDSNKIYKRRLTIGTVGRICYQKNPKLFNEIAEYFNKYDFIWVGDGELKNKLTSENIKITGWINRRDVIKELINIDIFIMTSLWEGLSISLLEAMYLGKPVIVSNISGNKHVVYNNLNGYIADSKNDYIKLINYIKLNNFSVDDKYKKKIQNNILEQYGKTQMVDEYMKLYNKTDIKNVDGEKSGKSYKVLQLLSTKTLNGAEKVALNICTNLDKNKFEALAVCAGDELMGYFQNQGIKVFKIDISKLNINELLKLRKVIKNESISLVHAHDVRASIAAKFAAANLKIPVISHIHGEYEWLTDKSKFKIIDKFFRRSYNLSLACSKQVKQFYCHYNSSCNKDKVISLPNCFNFSEINKNNFIPKEEFKCMNNIPKDKFVFGYIGRLIETKGIDLLIESIKLLEKSDLILIIIGAGEEKEKLKDLTEQCNLSGKIFFMGYRKDIYNWLNIIDCLVLPSKREGLPMVILEAMAMKKIVISTAIGGIPELIKNNYNGLLTEESNVQLLTEAMQYVYENQNVVSQIEENAYKYLKQNYNMEKYINSLYGIYNSLLI